MSSAEPVSNPLEMSLLMTFVAVFGAVVGSFLNVVIYRLPRGLSVNKPRRSFCPACKNQISWHQNLPIVSWILLRGRCAKCGSSISSRYPLVEALTAALFLALWVVYGSDPVFTAGLFVFCSIAIAATFIDLEHMIIPDSLTLGGVAAGLALSVVAPRLQGATDRIEAAAWSLFGALIGGLLLWSVVELGKLAFGRIRLSADSPEDPPLFHLRREEGGRIALVFDGESYFLDEVFSRESDRIRIAAKNALIDGRVYDEIDIRIAWDHIETKKGSFPMHSITEFRGAFTEAVLPREAMGLGDVKFMGAIGAFFGWKAVFFTLVVGSVTGAVIGIAILLTKRSRGERGAAIPFGPYLALGAMVWVFVGPLILEWYLDTLHPPLPY